MVSSKAVQDSVLVEEMFLTNEIKTMNLPKNPKCLS